MEGESVQQVVDELSAFVHEAIATHSFASWALIVFHDWVQKLNVLPENPDPLMGIGVGDPNLPSAVQYAAWKRSEVLAKVAQHGEVEGRLSQQWVVYTFTGWEHEYRPRIAKAVGVDTNLIHHPVFGDLRLLRNDIVHNHGVVAKAAKCELFQWFTAGDIIRLEGQHFAQFAETLQATPLEITE